MVCQKVNWPHRKNRFEASHCQIKPLLGLASSSNDVLALCFDLRRPGESVSSFCQSDSRCIVLSMEAVPSEVVQHSGMLWIDLKGFQNVLVALLLARLQVRLIELDHSKSNKSISVLWIDFQGYRRKQLDARDQRRVVRPYPVETKPEQVAHGPAFDSREPKQCEPRLHRQDCYSLHHGST